MNKLNFEQSSFGSAEGDNWEYVFCVFFFVLRNIEVIILITSPSLEHSKENWFLKQS